MVTGHGPLYVHLCLTPFHEAAKSLSSYGKTLNLGQGLIDDLQICSLKRSELGTISFTFVISVFSLVDSWKNRSKSAESMKIGTHALFDALFYMTTGHKLCEASIECF